MSRAKCTLALALRPSELVDKYKGLMSDPAAEVRQAATLALGLIGKNETTLVAEATADPDPTVRICAALVLANSGGSEAVKLLAVLSQDAHPRVQEFAVWCIGLVQNAQDEALSRLREELKEGNPEKKAAAINSLGAMGPRARIAIPQIVEAVEQDRAGLWGCGMTALLTIVPSALDLLAPLYPIDSGRAARFPPKFFKALGIYLSETDQAAAARELRELLAPALPPEIKAFGLRAIGAIAAGCTQEMASDVSRLLEDADSAVRHSAASALESMGSVAQAALPSLSRTLWTDDFGVAGICAEPWGTWDLKRAKRCPPFYNSGNGQI